MLMLLCCQRCKWAVSILSLCLSTALAQDLPAQLTSGLQLLFKQILKKCTLFYSLNLFHTCTETFDLQRMATAGIVQFTQQHYYNCLSSRIKSCSVLKGQIPTVTGLYTLSNYRAKKIKNPHKEKVVRYVKHDLMCMYATTGIHSVHKHYCPYFQLLI